MASKKQRKRKQGKRRSHVGGRFEAAVRLTFDPNAPSAVTLRQMWSSPEALKIRAMSRDRIMDGYPFAVDPDTREPLAGTLDPSHGWDFLETLHDFFVGRVQQLASDRGSAEWLWWLRRLQGQFDDVNDMRSTGPYIQAVAEALAAGISRSSSPLSGQPTFVFPVTPEVLLDLAWLSEISIVVYKLHAAMKRCAKGQHVVLIPGAVPRWEPEDNLDDAIEEYDSRTERETANLLRAVGIAAPKGTLNPEHPRIGGLVPHWYSFSVRTKPPFAKADPLPHLFEWIDLDTVAPLCDQSVLTEEHVALIALLWATFNIGTREENHLRRRMTTPMQWGYMVTPTDGFLIRALDEMCSWIPEGGGRAMQHSWVPGSAHEILEVLNGVEPSVWPPLCGNPVHEVDQHTLVDLVGASRRLFSTLLRPTDGAAVNAWSLHFEQNVQGVIDRTAWRPPDTLRSLIGRTIYRLDGSKLTDIDALAFHDGRLLLVSCKSIAFTIPALGGEFAVTRNIVDKTHLAASQWQEVVAILRCHPQMLAVHLPQNVQMDGCVVLPSVPYYTDAQWRRRVFGVVSYLVSVTELEAALSRT